MGDHRKDTLFGELLYVQVHQCSLAVRLEHTWKLESSHTILIFDSFRFHLFEVQHSFYFHIKHCYSSYFVFFPYETQQSVDFYISSYSSWYYTVSAVPLNLTSQARSTAHIQSTYKSIIMLGVLANYEVNFRHNEWQHSSRRDRGRRIA